MRPDHALPAAELGPMLGKRVRETVDPDRFPALPEMQIWEAEIAQNGERGVENDLADYGELAGFACPNCDGALLHLHGRPVRRPASSRPAAGPLPEGRAVEAGDTAAALQSPDTIEAVAADAPPEDPA